MIEPWEGSKWGQAGNEVEGVRLLIVGESGHAAEHEGGSAPPDHLCATVRKYINENPNWRFYRIVTALLTRKTTAEIDERRRAGAWESVAFCNSVPVIAANYSRKRPSRAGSLAVPRSAGPFRARGNRCLRLPDL